MQAARLNSKLSKFLLRIEPEESAKKEIKIREEILSLRPKRKVKQPEPKSSKENQSYDENEKAESNPLKETEVAKENETVKEPKK